MLFMKKIISRNMAENKGIDVRHIPVYAYRILSRRLDRFPCASASSGGSQGGIGGSSPVLWSVLPPLTPGNRSHML